MINVYDTMKFRQTSILSFLLFFVLCVAGQTMKETVTGNNSFAFELFKKLFNENKNVFFSPYSISSALAMTYGGARGETEKQMSEVLHYDLNQQNTHQGFFDINSSLSEYKNNSLIKLSVANALWKDEHQRFQPNFLELAKKYYNAAIFSLRGAKPINDWAKLNTNGKISEIVKDLEIAGARLVLTNAIYFKGEWLSMFATKDTYKSKFKTINGHQLDVDMMVQEGYINYFEDEQNQVIELPYKREYMSMTIILPKGNSSIKTLAQKIDYKLFSYYHSKLRETKVEYNLPKFSFASKFNLEEILPAMGMPDAFNSGKADFTGMSDSLSISKVIHMAFIEVNEKGSEAAAATVIEEIDGATKQQPKLFKADRPFMILICDKKTNSILFMGSVMNPAAKQ